MRSADAKPQTSKLLRLRMVADNIKDASKGCLICELAIPETHLVYRGDEWEIRHSSETNILGYCIIQARRHFLDLSEANHSELASYGNILSKLMQAQREILQYDRVYTFSLAEAVPHYHLHVIPKSHDFPR